MEKTCPYCGQALEKGFVQSGQRICWLKEKQSGAHLPSGAAGEFYLRGSGLWQGSACPGYYCPRCGLILLPQKDGRR